MFRHQMCHPQGAFFVTSLNYISTIAVLAKINKVFKNVPAGYGTYRTGQAQQQHQHTDCIYGHHTDFM